MIDFSFYKKIMNVKEEPGYEDFNILVEKIFTKFYPKKEYLTTEQITVFNEIFENIKLIKELLKPIQDLGINYSLSLVGGSIRDLVTHKTNLINDFDFVINIDRNEINKLSEETLKYLSKKDDRLIIDKELNNFKNPQDESYPYEVSANTLKYQEKEFFNILYKKRLLEDSFKKSDINFNMFSNKDAENKYLNKHINAIFQLNGINDKKIDLILSEYEGFIFMTTFDFEICKACIDLSDFIKKDIEKNKFIDLCLNNLRLPISMLKDLENKTLSIAADNFNVEHIDYFMNKHFLKLKDKFEDYEFNYFLRNSNLIEDKKEELNLLHTYKVSLENNKDVKNKKLKI